MKTLLFFESTVQSVSQSTAWYLADLGEYLGRQELYARQVPQKLKALKEADISIRKMIPQNILKTEGIESSRFHIYPNLLFISWSFPNVFSGNLILINLWISDKKFPLSKMHAKP